MNFDVGLGQVADGRGEAAELDVEYVVEGRTYMKTIQVVLDAKLLKAAAKRSKVNRSALIRHALREHLKREHELSWRKEFRVWEDAATWPKD